MPSNMMNSPAYQMFCKYGDVHVRPTYDCGERCLSVEFGSTAVRFQTDSILDLDCDPPATLARVKEEQALECSEDIYSSAWTKSYFKEKLERLQRMVREDPEIEAQWTLNPTKAHTPGFTYVAEVDSEGFEKKVKDLLLYHRVISAKVVDKDERIAELELDNGTVIRAIGSEGCGGCSNGWSYITDLNTCANAITNVECTVTGDQVEEAIYRIFVFSENKKIKLLEVEGSDNGYYGMGYWLEVKLCERAS